jgi:FlaA1/EpsC-like NDP-sugar epimerase
VLLEQAENALYQVHREIFILDMGAPVKIVDLARDLITLSGLRPDEDVEIKFTGVRPGEKLFEELSVAAENADKTRHPKIYVGRQRPTGWEALTRQLADLHGLTDASNEGELRKKLRDIVPEFGRRSLPPSSVGDSV